MPATVNVPSGSVSSGRFALVANTVTTVNFPDIGAVRVLADGTAAVYVTVDGSTPTVDGANCFELPSGVVSQFTRDTGSTPDVIKLISAGTPSVRVELA